VREFEKHLIDELDLMREAGNASQLRRNFLDSPLLYIPKIYWDFTRSDILTIERISGIPIADIESLKRHHINLKRLAERGIEIFFTQVFRDCFFHADMHPGNIFVATHPQENPQFIGVDFGIMGTLSALDQRYLAENMLAFFRKDYQYVAKLHIESGWVPPETRMDEFEAAIRTVSEPVFERPLKEISFGQLLLHLFQTARRFNMEIQPQLLLLQKTLFNIEGLGRQLYPEIDLWATAKPYIEHWVKQQMGMPALLKKIRKYTPYWLEKLPEIPDLLYQTLIEIRENQKKSAIQTVKKEVSLKIVSRKMNYIIGTLGALFLAMGLLNYFSPKTLKFFFTHHGFSWGVGGAGLLLLLLGMMRFRPEEP
jgi:ubiquinone biosynthesis protein